VVARVVSKARPDTAQTNGPRVALNLFKRQAGTIARLDFAQLAWQAEDADAFKVVTGKDDQFRRDAPLRLYRSRVAVGAEIALAQPPREQRHHRREVRAERARVL